MIFIFKNKQAQEELIGFGLIVVIIMIILMVFLSFSLRNPVKQGVESYEVESFIQATLQYNTDCAKNYDSNLLSVKDVIIRCERNELCLDERYACEVLNSTLKGITHENWQIGEDWPVKGYEFVILSNSAGLISFAEGNITNNYKGASQDYISSGNKIEVFFTAYY